MEGRTLMSFVLVYTKRQVVSRGVCKKSNAPFLSALSVHA